ncbi:MAG TPA: hypothetical protein VK427_22310, partial [Kofleriaceae bacterium]|nr:hypothetical protein [Kofleriaceae bacterium]
MRRFEHAGRYWEVELLGPTVQMKWGALDGPPQTFSRTFATDGDAEVFAERQILAQRERGYVELARLAEVGAIEVVVERHRRFESVNRFIEITQEDTKVTVRGGRIVEGRDVPDREQLHVQHFANANAATAGYEARCAAAQIEGARPTEAELVHAHHTSAELEAECEAAPTWVEPWAIYADWLGAHGDARGEIAALQRAGRSSDAKRVLGAHLRELCGTDSGKLAFEYRHGFAVACTITVEPDGDDLLEDVMRAVLASPMGRFLEALRFGLAGQGDDNDWGPTIHTVADSRRGPHVRALRFDHYDHEDSELSWTPFGDFSASWEKLPALEHLHIKSGAGGTLGALRLPQLRTFIRESGGLGAGELDAIIGATWPALEHLEIWFGSSHYGAEVELSSLRPIFAGTGLPALRHLGIVNCELVEIIIPELARSAILPRLVSLDLS